MQVHVGAVEQRIALADHGDGAAGIEMGGDRGGRGVVEVLDLDCSRPRALAGNLGRHRVAQGSSVTPGTRCAAAIVRARGWHCRLWRNARPRRPPCSARIAFSVMQLGIARADADADQLARGRSSPGPRQRIDRGRGHGAAAHAAAHDQERHAARNRRRAPSFDSAAPTKPTGMPRIAAGFGAPRVEQFEQAEQRGRGVADGDHGAGELFAHSSRRRRSGWCRALRRAPARARRASVQITSLRAGSRARVMPCATISASHRIGAPLRQRGAGGGHEARAEHDVLARPRHGRRHGSCAPRPRPPRR